MGKPGRPAPDLDDYLDWEERLQNFTASELTITKFCDEEGVSRSTFRRWKRRLRAGIPKSVADEMADHQQAKSGDVEFHYHVQGKHEHRPLHGDGIASIRTVG